MTSATTQEIRLNVNGKSHSIQADPETPLLYVLRGALGLKGPKYGCGMERCGACMVLVDGAAVPSCQLPVAQASDLPITTVEGLGTADDPHPLQEAFVMEQAIQCGYCAAGMIIAAQGLLNRVRYPTNDDIREALADNLCRCGVYDRVRRAIRLRVARPDARPIYEVRQMEPLPDADVRLDLPHPLQNDPSLDSWIQIGPEGTITVFSGKIEIGQGLQTALSQIAAEELDVALERVRVVMGDTHHTPNEGITAGSHSLMSSGNAIRVAAAEARQIMLNMAFEELEAASTEQLVVEDGTITDPESGRRTDYWNLMEARRFGRTATGSATFKKPTAHQLVGQPATRVDVVQKVTGEPVFVHDLELPDLVYGRVVHPPGYHARLKSVDKAAVEQMPGVLAVVQDGSFLGVIASSEGEAAAARTRLKESAVWDFLDRLPTDDSITASLPERATESFLVQEGAAIRSPLPTATQPPPDARTISAQYARPFIMHGAMGPSAAVAEWKEEKLTIWTHSQGVFPLRAALASSLQLDAGKIHVIHAHGAGCYGHNGADDAAYEAALLAMRYPGVPVSLAWTREDEHGWEPYGPAMVIRMQASLNAQNEIFTWQHDVWSYPHIGRPRPGDGTSGFISSQHLSQPLAPQEKLQILGDHSGSHRNADPLYTFPNRRVVKHTVPDSPLRTSSLRGLGAFTNVFAIESFIDELAHAVGEDPVTFRLKYLEDVRARQVIEAVAQKANWQSETRPQRDGRGRGFAFAQYKNSLCYSAVVVDLRVDVDSGEVHLERVVIGADAGQVVNPDGLSNQLEGGFVQAASWTLKEQVHFNENGITSLDWDSYPILRFPDAPQIETIILNRRDQPFLGAGEATAGPAPAAIANAIFDAVGIRLRETPFTPERVLAALEKGKRHNQ